ncbi:hypothetical protein, partial [Caballeronia calidae]|uniref:hypothetical protein n=1 Tax=Caballeronia calidae TaxID=1777139 RepID=UPI001E301E9A
AETRADTRPGCRKSRFWPWNCRTPVLDYVNSFDFTIFEARTGLQLLDCDVLRYSRSGVSRYLR